MGAADLAQDIETRLGNERIRAVNAFQERISGLKHPVARADALLAEAGRNPALWPEIRPQLVDVTAGVSPELVSGIPEQYDAGRVQQIGQFVTATSAQLDTLARTTARSAALLKGHADVKEWRETIAESYVTATSPEDWQAIGGTFRKLDHPTINTALDSFGEWSPENAAKVNRQMMTPAQRAALDASGEKPLTRAQYANEEFRYQTELQEAEREFKRDTRPYTHPDQKDALPGEVIPGRPIPQDLLDAHEDRKRRIEASYHMRIGNAPPPPARTGPPPGRSVIPVVPLREAALSQPPDVGAPAPAPAGAPLGAAPAEAAQPVPPSGPASARPVAPPSPRGGVPPASPAGPDFAWRHGSQPPPSDPLAGMATTPSERMGRRPGGDIPLSGGAPAPAAPIIVRAPNGKNYVFQTQAQADIFKRNAGIR